jgi:hypothetical protein
MKRWTQSDTVGLLISAAILIVPPVGVTRYFDNLRKPGQPPTPLETYLVIAGVGLIGALLSSGVAWRWGGSEHGRWAIHGLVASVMLITYVISCCFWPR